MSIKAEINVIKGETYLLLEGDITGIDTLKKIIFSELQKNGIKNIELKDDTLIKLINLGKERKYLRISSDSALFVKNEDIFLETSPDNMKGWIYFTPPGKGGRRLTDEEIRAYIKKSGLSLIDEEMLLKAIEKRTYADKYLIAKGIPPADENDGYTELLFDTEKKTLKPILTDSGKADYRNLHNIESAEKGQVLARKAEPLPGKEGLDIYGKTIDYRRGRPAPRLSSGRNTAISDDGSLLTATKSGQILYIGKRVSISEVLEINENVGPSTGNIDFAGSVKIYGNVAMDYEVKSGGNIEILGTFDGQSLTAEGNISVAGGVQGRKNTVISAKGNLSAKFLSGAKLNIGGNIYSDSIIRCETNCRGSIELWGPRSTLSGGKTVAGSAVYADVIGSPMAAATDIIVGLDPQYYIRYTELVENIKSLTEKAEEYSKSIGIYKRNGLMELSKEKKTAYYGLVFSLKHNNKKISEMKSEAEKLKGILDTRKNSGEVFIRGVVHPGVKIQVGNAVMYIRDDIKRCKIINENGTVKIDSY